MIICMDYKRPQVLCDFELDSIEFYEVWNSLVEPLECLNIFPDPAKLFFRIPRTQTGSGVLQAPVFVILYRKLETQFADIIRSDDIEEFSGR